MDPKSSQTFEVDEQNYLQLSHAGGRIMKLVLGGVTVIQAQKPFEGTGSGSFLMYPWVNRIAEEQLPYKPQFKDANGLPLHGIAVNLQCSFKPIHNQKEILITCCPNNLPTGMPNLLQRYTLSKGSLKVRVEVTGESPLPICYGYHPYLEINNTPIKDLQISSNINQNLKLDEKMLPVYPFNKSELHIREGNQYDHLFLKEGEGFVRLKAKDGPSVEISSKEMHYWQVYTPGDGARIAVEPMTFCGNLYKIYNKEEFGELPQSAEFIISLK